MVNLKPMILNPHIVNINQYSENYIDSAIFRIQSFYLKNTFLFRKILRFHLSYFYIVLYFKFLGKSNIFCDLKDIGNTGES